MGFIEKLRMLGYLATGALVLFCLCLRWRLIYLAKRDGRNNN